MDVVPYEESKRAGKRGALVGAVVGLIGFGAALTQGNATQRLVLGGLMITLGGGAWIGSGLALKLPYGDRPESKRGLLRLLALSSALGLACVIGGAYVAGITGENP